MTVRFRIRTSAGQEVSFATKEMFEDFVRSGDLSPDDLVYDRDTGSWSSAQTHPAVIEIQYELEPEAGSEGDAHQEEMPEEDAVVASAEAPEDESAGAPEDESAGAPEDVSAEAPDEGDATPEEGSTAGSEMELDFDLELTEEMSPEESKRIFFEQIEAERQADIDGGDSIRDSLSGFTIDSESMGQGLQDQPPASAQGRGKESAASGARPGGGDPSRRPSHADRGKAASRRRERGRGSAPRRRGQPDRGAKRSGREAQKGGGFGRVLRILVLLGLLAAGGYVVFELLLDSSGSSEDDAGAEAAEVDRPPPDGPSADNGDALPVDDGAPGVDEGAPRAGEVGGADEGRPLAGETGPEPVDAGPRPEAVAAAAGRVDAGPDPVDAEADPIGDEADVEAVAADSTEAGFEAPAPEPVIPETESAIRGRAQERYLAATQRALRELEPIPDVWPTGPYLSVPSDYPQVVDAWQDYLSTIQVVRPGDGKRYRVAYEAALDDAGVTGEARQERLDRGLADFAESAQLRQTHFDRVEALARAALQSHNALVEAEGTILYDATGTTGRQEGVGRGTSARDAASRLVLDQVIELLEAALDADGEGPGSGESVREWVWDGFLDAATR